MLNKIWKRAKDLFGLSRNNAYVKGYLSSANMRSAISMSAVIILIEIWMVIRYLFKNFIPKLQAGKKTFFQCYMSYTQTFLLIMFLALALMLYAIFYIKQKQNKKLFRATLICTGVSFLFACMLPFELLPFSSTNAESTLANPLSLFLLLSLYISIIAFDISILIATIYRYKGGRKEWLSSVLVISLFGLVCLIFGMRVSYGDFGLNKEIICFLMMVLYIGCLLIWKPYISIGVLGTSFLLFFFIINTLNGQYIDLNNKEKVRLDFQSGDRVNYITFLISLVMVSINIYDQRVIEARNSGQLERIAKIDEVTGLTSFEYMISSIPNIIEKENCKPDEWAYVFFDITSFKIFNEQRGYQAGNEFLKNVGDILSKHFKEGIISRQSDDHFAAFIPVDHLNEKLEQINNEVGEYDLDIRPGVKMGVYYFARKEESARRCVEKARYASNQIKDDPTKNFDVYNQEMHEQYHLNSYIVRHLDEAIEKGYIKVYYQPVAYSKDMTVCGVEALARWVDPKHGLLPPGRFVPILEKNHTVHKLDIAVMEIVCFDIRQRMDAKQPVFPVSINLSRLDFLLMDPLKELENLIAKYQIDRSLFHIEITESALIEDKLILKKKLQEFKDLGYQLWLDDFGSGYSSFNVLKEFEFDVIKLDMQLLENFDENPKAKIVIKSICSLAASIGAETLCEGVEKESEAIFLKENNCSRLQGFLFANAIPVIEFQAKIDRGELVVSKNLK